MPLMIGSDAASSLPCCGNSIAMLTVPLDVSPGEAAPGDAAPGDSPPGLAAPGVAAPGAEQAANASTAAPANAETLVNLIQNSSIDSDRPVLSRDDRRTGPPGPSRVGDAR